MFDLILAAALLQEPAAPLPEPAPANCPAWRLMRSNEQATGYVDPGSLRREGDTIQLMTRTILHLRMEQGVVSFNTPLELNCATRTARPLHYYNFDAGGRLVAELPGGEAVPVVPRSAFEALLDEFCPRGG
jgi:hypothetical protein